MSADIRFGAAALKIDEALYRKLETAIRGILVHYQGRYEESLVDWFLALRLTVPAMAHPWQLTDVFKHLLDAGIIELHKPGVGPYTGDDEGFFLGVPFTVVLTPRGMVQTPIATKLTLLGDAVQRGAPRRWEHSRK